MKIKFLQSVVYETEGRNKGPHYDAGKVYDLPDDKANRWIQRRVAELFVEPEPALAPAPEPAVREHHTTRRHS